MDSNFRFVCLWDGCRSGLASIIDWLYLILYPPPIHERLFGLTAPIHEGLYYRTVRAVGVPVKLESLDVIGMYLVEELPSGELEVENVLLAIPTFVFSSAPEIKIKLIIDSEKKP